jgi:hypothetical protein
VKVHDPVAFFGGVSYTANFANNVNGIELDPGDSIGFNVGLAVALNPETSINFALDERFTGRTRAAGANLLGSTQRNGVFRVGFTYALSKNYFVDMGVGIGLTTDSPDLQASIAVPFRLPPLFKD